MLPGTRIRVAPSDWSPIATGMCSRLTVRDTGVGIPTEMLPQIFGLFVQANQDRSRIRGGLGIGLALVRSLVELHGGTIQASSEGPGRGSEFIVRLPVKPRQTRDDESPGAPFLTSSEVGSGPPRTEGEPHTGWSAHRRREVRRILHEYLYALDWRSGGLSPNSDAPRHRSAQIDNLRQFSQFARL